MPLVVYQFYYVENRIVDHDSDGAVYDDARVNIAAFKDLNIGLEYSQYKFPNKEIKYDSIKILDIEEE